MSSGNNVRFEQELSYNTAAGDNTFQPFSNILLQAPALIVFDNLSNIPVEISDDGVKVGKTFGVGVSIVMDLRTNRKRTADDYTWRKGTQFFAKSAIGTGFFLISYIYAE
jgi:hypothetical protein